MGLSLNPSAWRNVSLVRTSRMADVLAEHLEYSAKDVAALVDAGVLYESPGARRRKQAGTEQ